MVEHRKSAQEIVDLTVPLLERHRTVDDPFALLAQANLQTLRKRLGDPYDSWEASNRLVAGLDGDLRVSDDTILDTHPQKWNGVGVALRGVVITGQIRASL
jgi:hypothetical protein